MSEQKKQRTIQVKIGNQAARAMTPDQAADYLKMIAGKGWGTSRELKMTFDNGSTSTVSLPHNGASSISTSSGGGGGAGSSSTDRPVLPRSDGLPCSEKEMKALMSMFVEVMGLQMNTDRLNKTTSKKAASNAKPPATTSSTTKQSQPRDTNGINKKNKPLFQFPEDIPPPPGGWPEDLLWPASTEDSSTSVDSLPNLEDIPDEDIPDLVQKQNARIQPKQRPKTFPSMPPVPGTKEVPNVNGPVTGLSGIVPYEWSALERSAIEDALEQEERIRKDNSIANTTAHSLAGSSSSGGKTKGLAAGATANATNLANGINGSSTNNKKSTTAKITPEDATAALRKVEVANMKLGKAVATWRTRVANAVAQNETARLEALLLDSPLPAVAHLQQQAASALSPKQQESSKLSYSHHWEVLVPLTVPKNRCSSGKGGESRLILTKYILSEQPPDCMFAIGRNGRSAVHTACLYGDIATLQYVFAEARKVFTSDIMEDLLLEPCQDSGWTPLHYAAVSGNIKLVETIFAACCDDDTVKILCCATTNATQTWKKGGNKGVTPAFLAEAVLSLNVGKAIETHGIALHDIFDHYKVAHHRGNGGNHTSAAMDSNNVYVHLTGFIYCRLLMVEETSYVELSDADIAALEREFKQKADGTMRKSNSTMSTASVASSTTATTAAEMPAPPQRDSIVDTEEDDNSSAAGAAAAPATEENDKKKAKRKKKKKNKTPSSAASSSIVENASTKTTDLSEQKTPNRRNPTAVDVAIVSSADPLICALEGMGFDHHQVLAGIEACGGSSRATADDVVAWIFGSDVAGGGSNEPAPSQSNKKSEERRTSKTRTKEKETPSVHSMSKSEAERRNLEAAKQLEEERLAAEKLAAKREEQRRRNREWNSRAQARQAMEAQDRVAKASSLKAAATRSSANPLVLNTGLKTGIAPTTNYLSGVRGPAVTAAAASTTSSTTPILNAVTHKVTRIETNPARRETATTNAGVGAMGMHGQPKADSGIDKALSNDASTVASSLGPTMFEVEITNNDDATVSTMGSFPAVPQLSAPNLAPPGFDSDGIPIFDGIQQRESTNAGRWDTTQRPSSFGEMHVPQHGFSPFAGVQMVPPPGIPESGPLMDRLAQHNDRSQSFSIPYGARHMPLPTPSQRSFSTGTTHYATGGMADVSMRSCDSSHMAHTDASASNFLPGGFSRMQPPTTMGGPNMGMSPGSHHDFGNDGPAIPGLMGFGSSLNQGVPMDSAIIDSISTSNAVLGVSDLWGDSKVMGASLLDTLLESSRAPTESSPGVVPASALFSSSESLHSSGGDQRIPGATWQNGLLSRSQSVSSSGGGTGGHGGARSGSIW